MATSINSSGYYEFEEKFDVYEFTSWFSPFVKHSFSISILYVIVIFGIKWYMQARERLDGRNALAAWSGILAAFSIMGAIRCIPDLYESLSGHGFVYSFCDNSYIKDSPTAFWAAAFTLSKGYELGDTVFIVLRKQKLIFLHWYHHITVLLYVWLNYCDHPGNGRWFMTMNYSVHALMYTYYTLKALKFHVPRSINIILTMSQLSQMVMGVIVNVHAYNMLQAGEPCSLNYSNIKWALLMYASYFLLFANFFYHTYLKPSGKKSDPAVQTSTNGVGNKLSGGDANGNVVNGKKTL